jgi:hypothetical protein
MLHSEGDAGLSGPQPFAATIVVARRLDILDNTSLAAVAVADRQQLEQGVPRFSLVASGELDWGGDKGSFIEFELDSQTQRLRQFMVLRRVGGEVWSVVGTHLAGPGFAAVRSSAEQVAASLTEKR